jgi:crotonobetainyl-CoA:carnitine CoA-transferase CaiB-like acyl-CoA transferase
VTAADPRSWEALCTGLGLDDLASRRIPEEEWPETTERLAEVFSRRSAAAWVADLGPRGAAVGAVNFGSNLLADPQVRARRSLIDVDGVVVPANPIRTGSHPDGSGQAPVGVPRVGEHTRSVLLEAGYGSPELDRLVAEGVVSE